MAFKVIIKVCTKVLEKKKIKIIGKLIVPQKKLLELELFRNIRNLQKVNGFQLNLSGTAS